LILRGKFVVSTEEVYQKLAAKIVTEEKQAKKGKEKRKSGRTASIDVEEDSEEELSEVEDIAVAGK
jgi:hypothetical protein